MKRTDFFIKLITVVLFIAVVSYIGVYLFYAALNSYETTTAISYTVERTYPAQGFIVRSETVLADTGSMALAVVSEGEKVAVNQTVAVEYMNSAALDAASEIRSLRIMIAQLETTGGSVAETTRLAGILDLSASIQRGDLSRLDELLLNIETIFFTGVSASAPDLPAMKARLELLEAGNSGIRTISAPVSGVFSHVVDGYEYIGPDALSNITPSRLAELFSAVSPASGVGKLVTEFKWYYAAYMDAADAARLPEGQVVTVQFSGAYYSSEEMTVEQIGRKEGDECVVLFSSVTSVHELAPFRRLRADIVSEVMSGIRVPKEAIHLDDNGVTHIFLQTGARAERIDVEILIESGDSYLVRDGAETGTPLRAGSTIIVKANNLYDGKVVG